MKRMMEVGYGSLNKAFGKCLYIRIVLELSPELKGGGINRNIRIRASEIKDTTNINA